MHSFSVWSQPGTSRVLMPTTIPACNSDSIKWLQILGPFLIRSLAVSHLVPPWSLSTQKQTSIPLRQPALQCHPVVPSPVPLFELSGWFTFLLKCTRYPSAAQYQPGWSQVLKSASFPQTLLWCPRLGYLENPHQSIWFSLYFPLKGIGLPVNSLIRITLRYIFRVLIQWLICRILFIV